MPCQPGQPVSDADLDRALAAAFAVEPSPEFVARVRMRVAREAAPFVWRRIWPLAAAAGCAFAIAGSVAIAQMDQPSLPHVVAGLAAVVPPLMPGPLALVAVASRRADRGNEKPSAETRAVMNANAERSTALRRHLEEKDYGALVSDAALYRQNFSYLETFWRARNVAGAIDISRAGLTAAAALDAAARTKDDAALDAAIAAIIGTCGACHKHYREELPDGSYEIRL
jgi:hypothetical protein